MAQRGCSFFRMNHHCGACEAGIPENCTRYKDENGLWPTASFDDVCDTCGKTYRRHGMDTRFNVASDCNGNRFSLV
ncbi:hypothetical protein WMF45_34645 [Sorangium sp. So ce448]|uniref:hypothetical protein n=1 Tax=Sorangium sp. So ce448 TaxID=3133314 RepID=UPI003F622E93